MSDDRTVAIVGSGPGRIAAPFSGPPVRCDRCRGADTTNPERLCDDCLAALDDPSMEAIR